MRTSKPCSTISYNTSDFLERKLTDLVSRGILDFWAYIEHFPEEDEEKKHKHLYLFPSKLLDTNQLRDELKEFDSSNPLKPLGVMPFMSSKFPDWYLYILHDAGYLASKGQSRDYHYQDNDIICSDFDFFNELKHQIDWTKVNTLGRVIDAAKSGLTFTEFIQTNNVPLLSVRSVQFVFEMVQNQVRLQRAPGSISHTPNKALIDEITGEFISN